MKKFLILLILVSTNIFSQTASQLKAKIDTDITNKTGPNSITKTNVGTNMKGIVNYVVQEITTINENFNALENGLDALTNTVNNNNVTLTTAVSNLSTPVVKTLKTTISLAQIHNLYSNPVTILNTATGVIRYPISIYILRSTTTEYTLANDYFDLTNSSGSFFGYAIPCAILSYTGVSYVTYNIPFASNGNGEQDTSFKLKANGGNPTGGSGGLDVYLTYVEIIIQ